MNISDSYYNNQSIKVRRLNKKLEKDLLKLHTSYLEKAPVNDAMAFQLYMHKNYKEYQRKADKIIDVYIKKQIRIQSKLIRQGGELLAFSTDSQAKKAIAYQDAMDKQEA